MKTMDVEYYGYVAHRVGDGLICAHGHDVDTIHQSMTSKGWMRWDYLIEGVCRDEYRDAFDGNSYFFDGTVCKLTAQYFDPNTRDHFCNRKQGKHWRAMWNVNP